METPARDKLEAIGLEEILERIESGETYSEIARTTGVAVSSLHRWLNETQERTELSARARTKSAEAWLDRGLDVVASALPKDGNIDASAARAYAQECARRAAIRNPQYSERVEQHHTGGVEIRSKEQVEKEIAAILSGQK